MTEKTITLRADLVERLEAMASTQKRTLNEVLAELLEERSIPEVGSNWALALAKAMENADIEWVDEPNISERSTDVFQDDLFVRWQQTQLTDHHDD